MGTRRVDCRKREGDCFTVCGIRRRNESVAQRQTGGERIKPRCLAVGRGKAIARQVIGSRKSGAVEGVLRCRK